ncbi:MAG: AIR synthase-related protein [Candidatus Aminicenantes bacterium]|jgi:phosphoribosylformylglycinamidine cyclo-ligase|nr:AIR synthase-related protein [Candidatus Aminicenantes bacterium]
MPKKRVKSEYARAGVDYTKIEPFKMAMVSAGKRTLEFPNKRGVYIEAGSLGAHGVVFRYRGVKTHSWCMTQEGLGNKNWIAEWMYQHAGSGRTYYEGIGIDTALMAANDVICQGALPVIYTDEVAAGDSEWFMDEKRSHDLAESFYQACEMCGMALPAGESPALRYLVKAEPPVRSAPSLSGCVTGIIAPRDRMVTEEKLSAGDRIIGATSSGLHANGISLVIKRALALKDKFLHRLPNGKTLGEEALIPTRSYVRLVEALQEKNIEIHSLLGGTGGGISKIAYAKRPFTYRVKKWVDEIPPLFRFMLEVGVSLKDCLTTFNWGIGFYIFVPEEEVDRTIKTGQKAGYDLLLLGQVEEGERRVIFEPERITLPAVE